jgi:hypothetical protein
MLPKVPLCDMCTALGRDKPLPATHVQDSFISTLPEYLCGHCKESAGGTACRPLTPDELESYARTYATKYDDTPRPKTLQLTIYLVGCPAVEFTIKADEADVWHKEMESRVHNAVSLSSPQEPVTIPEVGLVFRSHSLVGFRIGPRTDADERDMDAKRLQLIERVAKAIEVQT